MARLGRAGIGVAWLGTVRLGVAGRAVGRGDSYGSRPDSFVSASERCERLTREAPSTTWQRPRAVAQEGATT